MSLDEKLKETTKVITIHHKGEINVCTKFPGNPSDCWDILLKTTNVNLLVVQEET